MTADLAAPPVTVAAVEDAGRVLPGRFDTTAPPVDIGQISTPPHYRKDLVLYISDDAH